MAHIKILVGTVYGNALDVAECCKETLQLKGHEVSIVRQAEIEDVLNTGNKRFLVCTSTTGQGEIPDTLMHLYCQLKDRLPLMPDKEYGVIALGDSSYDAFAEAGCLMDSLFQTLKMKRLGEILFIDACETMAPCEDATHWLQDWMETL